MQRCIEDELHRGDIAILRREDGALLAHIVTATHPLRTSSFSGTPDAPGLRSLGKAMAVRRKGKELPLPASARVPLYAAHRVWAGAAKSPLARATLRLLLESTARFRRWQLSPLSVRLLCEADLPTLADYAPAGLAATEEELARLLRPPRRAAGAFLGNRLVGLGLAEGAAVRHLSTTLWARAVGLEAELLELLGARDG
ncbi:MAG: hypothetical protein ACOZIN_04750 [Myxococcota bacterium]